MASAGETREKKKKKKRKIGTGMTHNNNHESKDFINKLWNYEHLNINHYGTNKCALRKLKCRAHGHCKVTKATTAAQAIGKQNNVQQRQAKCQIRAYSTQD